MLLNKSNQNYLDSWTKSPHNPLCIETGFTLGHSHTVDDILASFNVNKHSRLNIVPDGNVIKIEQVREIRQFLKLRQGTMKGLRGIIIHGGQQLNLESQNALLKTLEELPTRTIFIMVVNNARKLKQTVVSRFWLCKLLPVSVSDVKRAFSDTDLSVQQIETAIARARGNPDIVYELLSNTRSEINDSFTTAKEIISQDTFTRLSQVSKVIESDKIDLHLYALRTILRSVMKKYIATNELSKLKRVIASMKRITETNPETVNKLVLTDIYLNI